LTGNAVVRHALQPSIVSSFQQGGIGEEDVTGDSEDFDALKRYIDELLKDGTLPDAQKQFLLEKLFEERNQRREFALKQAQAQAADALGRKQFWHNTPLVVALVGTITIAANGISGWMLSSQNTENAAHLAAQTNKATERLKEIEATLGEQGRAADAEREANKDERAFAFKIIEVELAKSSDTKDRARVLLFLVRAGILNSLNRNELEQMALNDLGATEAANVGIPPTLGSASRPSYDLPVPSAVEGQTPAASRLLEIAIREINEDIDEVSTPETVKKYWSVLPGFGSDVAPEMPWSGAFIAWLVSESGNPDQLQLSANHWAMWKSCLSAGIAFQAADKAPLPGDLVFFSRSPADTERFRAASGSAIAGLAGVVHEVKDGSITVIAGNTNNGVRLVTYALNDARLVGFARLGGKS
jgi:hypothetical protein